MLISDIEYDYANEDRWKVSATVAFERGPRESRRVWFQNLSPMPAPPESADPFFASFAIPSMYLGEPLNIEGAVSQELASNFETRVQPILRRWYPSFQALQFTATGAPPTSVREKATGVASTFSGGLDSLYSVVKNRARITHLLVVSGFDCVDYHPDFYPAVVENVKRIAESRGMTALALASNISEVGDAVVSKRAHRIKQGFIPLFHARVYFGSVLVSFGLLLRPVIGELQIANTHPYERINGAASNPILDPAWSISDLQVRHDGAEFDRTGKANYIAAAEPESLDGLRVCHNFQSRGVNCCVCEKCLRTMASLRLIGALENCTAFSEPLDLDRIARMRWPNGKVYWQDILEEARDRGDRALENAVLAQIGQKFNAGRFMDSWQLVQREIRKPASAKRLRKRLRNAVRQSVRSALKAL